MTWQALCERFPWLAKRPVCGPHVHGWVLHEAAWREVLGPRPNALVLEVGAWTGKNSLHLLERFPGIRLVAVDRWQAAGYWGERWREWIAAGVVGSEHGPRDLYLANVWPHRDRVVAVQDESTAGMRHVAVYIEPDVVYIDAAHDFDSVLADISHALELFPRALITGDDYEAGNDVARAVHQIANERRLVVEHLGRFWRYA